jgi:hypothetical protein
MTTSAVNLPRFYWVIDTHRLKCMRFATETRLGLAILQLSSRFGCWISVLDPVTQEQCATIKRTAALQSHRRDWRAPIGLGFRRVEDARRPFRAVHRRTEDQVEFVNESRTQERAVGSAPSFEQQSPYAKFAGEEVQSKREIEL